MTALDRSTSVVLAGTPFECFPASSVSPDESALLTRLAFRSGGAERGVPPVRVELLDTPPWSAATMALQPERGPAALSAHGRCVRMTHRAFLAEIDPVSRLTRIFRLGGDPTALNLTLRVALCAQLPVDGGLPVHAAGVVTSEGGLVFFGPSGAGKSTLADTARSPLLSDELVAITGAPPKLEATGYWGDHLPAEPPRGPAPLRALFELEKGPLGIERLAPEAALRRLIGVSLVPAHPELWALVLGIVGRLARTVPVYGLRWTPPETPWAALSSRLAGDLQRGEG